MMPVRGQTTSRALPTSPRFPSCTPTTDRFRTPRTARSRPRRGRPRGVPFAAGAAHGNRDRKEESGVRGVHHGENPVISDPDVAPAEHWFRARITRGARTVLTETARYADVVLRLEFRREDGHFCETRAPYSARHRPWPQREAAATSNPRRLRTPRLKTRSRPRKRSCGKCAGDAVWRGVTYQRLEGRTAVPVPTATPPDLVPLRRPVPTAEGKASSFPGVRATASSPRGISVRENSGRQRITGNGHDDAARLGLDQREPTPTVEITRRRAASSGWGRRPRPADLGRNTR